MEQALRLMLEYLGPTATVIGIIIILVVPSAVKILPEYERAVIFRLGRVLRPARGPGIVLIIPLVDRLLRVPLRVVTMEIPKQEIITSDNVTLKVNAVMFFRVMVPDRAIIEVENYQQATFQYSQTTLRSVLGQSELDDLLVHRDKMNQRLQQIIDEYTEAWGIKVTAVEIKDVELPESMQRAMAKQAEADRERRAKIINADGELQASEKLAQAAQILGRHHNAIQLRFLQTLAEMASERNTHTVVLPIPIDFLGSLLNRLTDGGGAVAEESLPPQHA